MNLKRRSADMAATAMSLALRSGGRAFYRFVLDSLWERQPFFEQTGEQEQLELALYYPGYVEPDPSERELVQRIFDSYAKMKAAQAEADPVFLPSSAWQVVIDSAFAPLNEGLAQGDLGPFHHFLANFRSWKITTGMEPSQKLSEIADDPQRREHFEQRVVAPLLRWWLRAESHGRDLTALTLPRHGNQCGVMANGHLVAPSSVFCEVYGRMLAGFVSGERPVVAELGAGFGKLLYFISQNLGQACLLDVDLPESLACAAYFLLKSFPERSFLLYGEGELSDSSFQDHDFVLVPSFEIGKLPDRSIDLFINENSLGVMSPEACRLFVTEICRSSKAFYHRNTESARLQLEEGGTTLLNHEFPIPEDEFELIVRYSDISRMMCNGRLNFDSDMYWYYYKRKDALGI